ncbi:hypothetical protein PVA45_00310 [Entomospira entomophila]|uniref:Uncharacterized protein n=1 Tax=Entomospira entomophila TaxID=2719988 RepID=A0A968G7E3_9SPIO|nr:hypothetical protein [Entomospira entomophilus]NIZ39963.1 hypothetical protein [Entomospira entomophilus]WDI35524.1 hypothetical protein PVA45_00310 [Entomospira entomophilus]
MNTILFLVFVGVFIVLSLVLVYMAKFRYVDPLKHDLKEQHDIYFPAVKGSSVELFAGLPKDEVNRIKEVIHQDHEMAYRYNRMKLYHRLALLTTVIWFSSLILFAVLSPDESDDVISQQEGNTETTMNESTTPSQSAGISIQDGMIMLLFSLIIVTGAIIFEIRYARPFRKNLRIEQERQKIPFSPISYREPRGRKEKKELEELITSSSSSLLATQYDQYKRLKLILNIALAIWFIQAFLLAYTEQGIASIFSGTSLAKFIQSLLIAIL